MTQQIQNNPYAPTQSSSTPSTDEIVKSSASAPVEADVLNALQISQLINSVQSLLSGGGPELEAPITVLEALKVLASASAPSSEAVLENLNNKDRALSIKNSIESILAQAEIDAIKRAENIHKIKSLIIYLDLPEEINLVDIAKQANAVAVAMDQILDFTDPENSSAFFNRFNAEKGFELGDEGYRFGKEFYISKDYMAEGYDGTIEENLQKKLDDNNIHGLAYEERKKIDDLTVHMNSEDINSLFSDKENNEIDIEKAIHQITEMYRMPEGTSELLSLLMGSGAKSLGEIATLTAGQDVSAEDIYNILFKDSIDKLLPMAILNGDGTLSDLEFASVVLDVDLDTLAQFEQSKNYMKIMAALAEKIASLYQQYNYDDMDDWDKNDVQYNRERIDGMSMENLQNKLEYEERYSYWRVGGPNVWAFNDNKMILALKLEIAERESQIALLQSHVDTAKDLININIARSLA